jgi:hypothetical protein
LTGEGGPPVDHLMIRMRGHMSPGPWARRCNIFLHHQMELPLLPGGLPGRAGGRVDGLAHRPPTPCPPLVLFGSKGIMPSICNSRYICLSDTARRSNRVGPAVSRSQLCLNVRLGRTEHFVDFARHGVRPMAFYMDLCRGRIITPASGLLPPACFSGR